MLKSVSEGRRLVLLATGALLFALLLLGGAAWRDLTIARSSLSAARDRLTHVMNRRSDVVTAAGRHDLLTQTYAARTDIDAASKRLHTSVPLSLLRFVPGLRTQRAAVIQLAEDSRSAVDVGAHLIAFADNASTSIRVTSGRVPLDVLSQLDTQVREGGQRIRDLVRSSSGLWGAVGAARRKFDAVAVKTSDALTNAADGLRVAHGVLGANGSRTYFVAIQNNAEMRDQGMVLSYAVIRATAGTVSFVRSGPITELQLHAPVPVTIPVGTAAVFGSTRPTTLWQSVNATADFAWSARTMTAMYAAATGGAVDGVIAIDVRGLAKALEVIGPVPVAGVPQPLTSASISGQLLHDLYQHAPHDTAGNEREDQVGAMATRAIVARLSSGSFDAVALGSGLGDAAAGGHFRMWSASASEEEELARVGLGGGPATSSPDRTFHLAVQNRTATKLDYYVHPEVSERIDLTPSGDAIVRTTITVRNEAPVGAPPSEQLGPDGEVTSRPGEYIASVCWWGPAGSSQDDASSESGLQLTQYLQVVAAGQQIQRTIVTVIRHAVHNGRLSLRYVPQPRLDPVQLSVLLYAPGWRVQGERVQRLSWDRVLRLTWSMTR